ncbi:hypothetical protein [Streptomyces sampsonii]|uniref:hypothetical protein n=1 Tax=Streptomyces sampsonii TaxID=42239 RepID=UPI0009A0B3F3|nr:hypothetical protein [Streptomyces sampsonii]
MAVARVQHGTYSVDVDAPAGAVYATLADRPRWPLFLRSSIHVERLDFDGVDDRFQAWTQQYGTVRSCLVRRTLDAGAGASTSVTRCLRARSWPTPADGGSRPERADAVGSSWITT